MNLKTKEDKGQKLDSKCCRTAVEGNYQFRSTMVSGGDVGKSDELSMSLHGSWLIETRLK